MGMIDILRAVFSTAGFEPHSVHFASDPSLMWFIVLSNALIVLAYVLIPISLVFIVRKRKDLVFNWIFLLFGLFILLCGMTHVMHILIFWYPLYLMEAIIVAITGVVSFGTFFALLIAISQIVVLTSPKQLENVGKRLSDEIETHNQAKKRLALINQDLQKAEDALLKKKESLEQANEYMVRRELIMVDLKKQINKLMKSSKSKNPRNPE